jgi:hypothetical protein
MVAHACNLNYLGGRDWEDCSSLSAQVKVSENPSQQQQKQKTGVVMHSFNHSYMGGLDRRIMVQAKTRPYLKNNL